MLFFFRQPVVVFRGDHVQVCVFRCVLCVQQCQGAGSSAVQSEASPRQVRSRWTEQLNPLTICSSFSPSPTKSQEEEEEEEEDFHPQSLESVLGEGDVEEEDGEEEEESEVSMHRLQFSSITVNCSLALTLSSFPVTGPESEKVQR